LRHTVADLALHDRQGRPKRQLIGVDHYVAMIAEHDLAGPLLDLVTAVLALGDPP
jgi:hypothetical protein